MSTSVRRPNHHAHVILCSSTGLGHYTPGLSLAVELRRFGAQATVEVFERLLPSPAAQGLAKQVVALWERPKMLPTLQAMAAKYPSTLDKARETQMFERWRREGFTSYIALSGAWLSVLKRYQEYASRELSVRCLHIDSSPSPSWQNQAGEALSHDWLLTDQSPSVMRRLKLARADPLQKKRVLLHGGGWHLAELSEAIAPLLRANYQVLANANRPIEQVIANNAWFRIDPQWSALSEPEGTPDQVAKAQMPRLQIKGITKGLQHESKPQAFRATARTIHTMMQTSIALITKPGGASLLESLETACPIIFLPTHAEHERLNQALWERLGFGLSWERWLASGLDAQWLVEARERLVHANAQARHYPSELVHGERP